MSLTQKQIFQGVKNVKNCILTLKFHIFWSTWESNNFKTCKLLGFILQDITSWNHKNVRNCYFVGYFWGLGTNVEFHGFLWFCEFLKNFKLGFFRLFWIYFRMFIIKKILCQDYHSARWYWCKKVQKSFPQTWDKIFFLNA